MGRREDGFLEFGPGRRTHYVMAGEGPDVVYFPANGGSVEDMHLLIGRIADDYRFVGIDPPGREPTEWPDEPFSFFDDLPRVYDRALTELGVGRHVAMGHSMGGMYALHHAKRHGDQVRALVLYEGFVTLPIHYATAAPDGARPHRVEPAVAEAFVRRHQANRKWEADRPAFQSSFWPSQQPHDARPWVAGLNLPILVFIGENGQELPGDPAGWRRQLGMDQVKELTVEVVPQAGHWMMLDDPGAVGEALLRFLGRLRPW